MIRLIALLALLTAFPPLATDMYLPAIPLLQSRWEQPLAVVNLTLVLFFVTYCVSLLVYGPLSDRYGRRPPLLAGIVIFVAASLLCSMATNIWALIVARILQAAGAGAASAISMAIAKDRLKPVRREAVLGYIAVIMALAPMLSPMIGSLIMTEMSWRWIFGMQGAMGMIALISVYLMPESHTTPSGAPAARLAKNYFRIMKNPRFTGMTLCISLVALPLFAFIAGSADIYITRFGLSETVFSLFFGGNAFAFMCGAFICARAGSRIGTTRIISLGFSGILAGGVCMLLLPGTSPWHLALPMSLITFSCGLSRPTANNLTIEQVENDTGTASSVMVFSYFIFGALSMAAVSLQWRDTITYLGMLSCVTGVLTMGIWQVLKSRVTLAAGE